ncbi:membrane protein insertase YidC [Desulforhopalus singaporensis]|uniref:Membrane protein insertase YidC n=1 Tax=Desulforhopalus singaporensis TaxID=91360 RepID=A0A1H0JMK0_9BACT|nr:membrane protein insertase YidC [Desulforhopalus singaporensis]SDO45027.1 protein translocase subunit yidC [Desulforhopalus singaporensis]
MDTYRAFLAILISLAILLGYQYFFVGFDKPAPENETATTAVTTPGEEASATPQAVSPAPPAEEIMKTPVEAVVYDRTPEEVTIDTDLYTATISEDGGTVTSFVLKKHMETKGENSKGMELVKTSATEGFPLQFSWGSAVGTKILYTADSRKLTLSTNDSKAELHLVGRAGNGLTVERVYRFDNQSYLMDMTVKVINGSGTILQGAPHVGLVNKPFTGGTAGPANRFLFNGPAIYLNDELSQVKADEFEEGPKVMQGAIDWAGYEGNYFLCGVVPLDGAATSFTMQGTQDLVRSEIGGALDTLQPGSAKEYKYHVFYGPKKLKMLKEIGFNLDRSVNFGWFDLIAKPALWLLNMFYGVFHNYGIAIILVTVLFKGVFWPISQKGMKSMKNMQKLQPKMVKIKEKYKNDPTRMNQEVMNLYKTYKVNPLGGCLPMVLQIPVFFALYKVLLQAIELRHAPFMLWITDLSAPDRLWLGFQIPYLGGLPVLTLLMGASMFLQQKLTPTTADPTQARIMMFLPVIFTFMFLNFASGLVLYWFVNNLLSILQQVLINREKKTAAA